MPASKRPSHLRLPSDVHPLEYDLHLEPDLDAGRFKGNVRIVLRLVPPTTRSRRA
jgi:hypothetical protein